MSRSRLVPCEHFSCMVPGAKRFPQRILLWLVVCWVQSLDWYCDTSPSSKCYKSHSQSRTSPSFVHRNALFKPPDPVCEPASKHLFEFDNLMVSFVIHPSLIFHAQTCANTSSSCGPAGPSSPRRTSRDAPQAAARKSPSSCSNGAPASSSIASTACARPQSARPRSSKWPTTRRCHPRTPSFGPASSASRVRRL